MRGDLDDLRDELGDLLLQVVFHARMAQEQGAFDFGDVVETLTAKLIRRHPHVFGDEDARRPMKSRACGSGSKPRRRRRRSAGLARWQTRLNRRALWLACRSGSPP